MPRKLFQTRLQKIALERLRPKVRRDNSRDSEELAGYPLYGVLLRTGVMGCKKQLPPAILQIVREAILQVLNLLKIC
jgi:hypothetical protein